MQTDLFVGWLVGCLTSQQHASVSRGRICSDNFTCCRSETEVSDQTFHHSHSQYTETGPTSPSADPITPGRVATGVPILKSLVGLDPEKFRLKWDWNPGSFALEVNALTIRPMRRFADGTNVVGATHGVMVSTSAFLACHQCYCPGSSLAWGLNVRALVCGIFLNSSAGVFSRYSSSLPPPSLHRLMVQLKLKINAISTLVKLNS